MTHAERNFVGPDTYGSSDPGPRLAEFLRRRYRRDHRVKRLADDLSCTPKAAENMLSGHWPGGRLFGQVVRRFGQDVIDALFGSDIDRARLEEEVRQLEDELERKRAGLGPVGVSVQRSPRGVAAPQDRAFG